MNLKLKGEKRPLTVFPYAEFLLDLHYENLFEEIGKNNDFHCKGCDLFVKRWERQDHYLNHKEDRELLHEANRVAAKIANEDETSESRTDVCVGCGKTFTQPKKRGRPSKKCQKCRK